MLTKAKIWEIKNSTPIIPDGTRMEQMKKKLKYLNREVIFIRFDRTITDPENFLGTASQLLFMMNPDGTEMEEIIIPD